MVNRETAKDKREKRTFHLSSVEKSPVLCGSHLLLFAVIKEISIQNPITAKLFH
jgi:hypothetical protein